MDVFDFFHVTKNLLKKASALIWRKKFVNSACKVSLAFHII